MSISPQYHFRKVDWDVLIWDVRKLAAQARDLPVQSVKLASIRELHEPYWFEATGDAPTVKRVIEHMKQLESVDLSYPIILCADGRVMDGMHRVAKAYYLGNKEILAKKFLSTPPHDHKNLDADSLYYGAD